MSKKVKAKLRQTLAGAHGLGNVGDEVIYDEKHAKELEEKGLLEITGEASDDDVVKSEKESSFSITDNTGKKKEKAEQETDKSDPTGQGKAKEKNDKAGPGSTKEATAPKKKASKK